jgi:hypothetical protein
MCKQGASELEKDKSPSRVLQRRSRGIKLERGAGRTIKLLDEFGSHQAVGVNQGNSMRDPLTQSRTADESI